MSQKGFTQDLLGQRFERLLVIQRAPNRGFTETHPEGRVYWVCRCDCNTEKVIAAQDLRSRRTRSCGCLQRESRCRPYGEAAFNLKLAAYRRDAKNMHRCFHLSIEQFRELITQNCFYCGAVPSQVSKCPGGKNGTFVYNGIDRKNQSEGYTIENCVPACKACNFMKGHKLSFEQFVKQCIAVARKHDRQRPAPPTNHS